MYQPPRETAKPTHQDLEPVIAVAAQAGFPGLRPNNPTSVALLKALERTQAEAQLVNHQAAKAGLSELVLYSPQGKVITDTAAVGTRMNLQA